MSLENSTNDEGDKPDDDVIAKAKFIGVYFEDIPSFVSLDIKKNQKIGKLRNLNRDTCEISFWLDSSRSKIFKKGKICAYGGEFFFIS